MKLLPFAVLAFIVWNAMTATRRVTQDLMERSEPLGDWTLLEPVHRFATTLGVKPFDVRILEIEQINGLALPGGEVFISRGLYNKYLAGGVTRDEVASVIAHEIGHVALGHHRRRLNSWRTETAALALIWYVLSRMMLGWIALLATVGLNVVRNQMSQRDEFEADAFSAQLMMRAGADARAVITLLEKLSHWSGEAGRDIRPMSWLMTHPPIKDRIAHARLRLRSG
ncbi:MAG: M48 family metallopeptidase, partial [Pseudomonadota bacterium]